MKCKKNYKAKRSQIEHGICSTKMDSWEDFITFATTEQIFLREFIFRGQKKESWKLFSTLDRYIKKIRKNWRHYTPSESYHLDQFKTAARGRRGNQPNELSENEWWALGQHFGLYTPFLDWTNSIFIAAYFAFVEKYGASKNRVVYALSKRKILEKNKKIVDKKGRQKSSIVEFIAPSVDDNARLINQSCIFSKAPMLTHLESWIKKYFRNESKNIILLKILIPSRKYAKYTKFDGMSIHPEDFSDRKCFLRALERMNINHLSLFPDLHGAATYCNISNEVGYDK